MQEQAFFYEVQSALGEKIHGMRARKDIRELRLIQLDAMVGAAKGRVTKQPKAQEFLERLQERCHQKSVGLYEELLSAVVQDVLPGEKNVGLTLKTARGLPSLDIEMVKAGGERESILEGSGGALTNILSAGLRVIALARSGGYPFLVLDEPDCWLKPSLVPQFANVLKQIAEDLGIQMLIISHHEPDAFAGFSSQVILEKHAGELSAKRVGMVPPDEWSGVKTGIKELRLYDFMSHKKTVIALAPGVTCLTGENDIGKSAIVAGLRALFYGAGTDSSIAHGESYFKCEARFHDDSVVSVERYLKKSPKQRWRYYVSGQSEPVQDSSPKDGAPEWLDLVAKIAKTEDLDIAFANQKSPVFLLDQVPSRQARILAVGRESMHLQRLIAKNKECNMLDARMIRDGESEGAGIKRELQEMARLDDQFNEFLCLKRSHEEWYKQEKVARECRKNVERGHALSVLLTTSKLLLSIGHPQQPKMQSTDALSKSISRLQTLVSWAQTSINRGAVLVPVIAPTDALHRSLVRLARVKEVAALKDVVQLACPAKMVETEKLSMLIHRLKRSTRLAHVQWTVTAVPIPVLAKTEKLRDLGRRLSRLGKVITASNPLLLKVEAEKSPALVAVDALGLKISVLTNLRDAMSVLMKRIDVNGQNKIQLDQSRKVLVESAGGQCPTCGSVAYKHNDHGSESGNKRTDHE